MTLACPSFKLSPARTSLVSQSIPPEREHEEARPLLEDGGGEVPGSSVAPRDFSGPLG